jgi:hypothetical protein
LFSLDLVRRALVILLTVVSVASSAGQESEWLAALRRWRPQYVGKGSSVRGPVDFVALEKQWLAGYKGFSGPGSQQYFETERYYEHIRRMIRPGDVVVFYRMDDRSFNQTGWAIIRAGNVIYSIPGAIVN